MHGRRAAAARLMLVLVLPTGPCDYGSDGAGGMCARAGLNDRTEMACMVWLICDCERRHCYYHGVEMRKARPRHSEVLPASLSPSTLPR